MCAHLRLLTVHSPGRQFAQPQLANAFVSFVERLEGRKGGEKGDGKETRWAEPIRRIFKNTRIETRSFLADPIKGLERAWKAEEVMPKIIEDNTKVASETISRALSACSMKPSDIDNVFFSSPLFSAPAISVRAMNHLPFRKDVKHWPMMGLGCVGGVALLSRATDYLRAFPTQSVLTLTVESGSRFWYGTLYHTLQELLSHPKPNKEKVMQQVLLAALFGDAVSCSILYGAESPFLKKNIEKNDPKTNANTNGPSIVDYVSLLVPNSEDLVSHHVESSGLQSYLSSKLGSVAPGAMVEAVEQLLQKHKLRKEDISHWFVHAGGPKMLTYFENEYGLKNNELKYCWKALAEVGNVSSATVPRTYELAMASEPKNKFKNSYGIMVAAGPGLTIEAVLLKWT